MSKTEEALPPLPDIVIRADNHYRGEGLADAVRDYARAALAQRQQVPTWSQLAASGRIDKLDFRVPGTMRTEKVECVILTREDVARLAALTAAPPAQQQQSDSQRCIDARNKLNAALHGDGANGSTRRSPARNCSSASRSGVVITAGLFRRATRSIHGCE